MMKNIKPSHNPQPLPTKDSFKITDDDIMKMVEYHYRLESKKFHDFESFKGCYIDLALPLNSWLISDSCKNKIINFFLKLGWNRSDIYAGEYRNDNYYHIKLNI